MAPRMTQSASAAIIAFATIANSRPDIDINLQAARMTNIAARIKNINKNIGIPP